MRFRHSLFLLIVLLFFIGGSLLVWYYNDNTVFLPNKELFTANNTVVSNDTSIDGSLVLRVTDVDSDEVIKYSYTVRNNSELLTSGFAVSNNFEVVKQMPYNETLTITAWAYNQTVNYYSDSTECIVAKDKSDCRLQLKRKGEFSITLQASNEGGVIALYPAHYLRKPMIFLTYEGLFNPMINNLHRCIVPKSLVLQYDKCYQINDYLSTPKSYSISYDLLSNNASLEVLVVDEDFIDGQPVMNSDDVKSVKKKVTV